MKLIDKVLKRNKAPEFPSPESLEKIAFDALQSHDLYMDELETTKKFDVGDALNQMASLRNVCLEVLDGIDKQKE